MQATAIDFNPHVHARVEFGPKLYPTLTGVIYSRRKIADLVKDETSRKACGTQKSKVRKINCVYNVF